MTLKAIYQRFLDLPNPLSLSENVSLHYITTLKTFSSPAKIVQHLETQNKKEVKTKNGRIISAVESPNAVALEIETVLEFISGGGTYLPGLENFIVDKIATIPTVGLCGSYTGLVKPLTVTFPDSFCPFRRRTEDLANSHLLGSGIFAQTDRSHWIKRQKLAGS